MPSSSTQAIYGGQPKDSSAQPFSTIFIMSPYAPGEYCISTYMKAADSITMPSTLSPIDIAIGHEARISAQLEALLPCLP
ncbi:hypothetical protein O1611_g9874 [Lasiodiplodia mahajangana]|uniref:Uncharacterized protein n=1 Tax=Lasiodiplodia mahajangana TaxID=1108764 RepID=A0ACC2J4E9_9PEZI|nr:hypothetical protein O1611_g9874 [Lasiodiplodia mahajangana]